ncbi:DUF1217 domain-containing protein [Leisingera caerulea]|uniref:DUF1217 domain-containing protein n=1 Tax=Leisingera caerulea TaxID=506591 RepID=A0ABY5WVZ9_LEICA|nr:DUF1217 domain-containing protein [Leisingera caerulea]
MLKRALQDGDQAGNALTNRLGDGRTAQFSEVLRFGPRRLLEASDTWVMRDLAGTKQVQSLRNTGGEPPHSLRASLLRRRDRPIFAEIGTSAVSKWANGLEQPTLNELFATAKGLPSPPYQIGLPGEWTNSITASCDDRQPLYRYFPRLGEDGKTSHQQSGPGPSRWIRAQQPLSHNTFSAAKLISTIRETGRLKTAL